MIYYVKIVEGKVTELSTDKISDIKVDIDLKDYDFSKSYEIIDGKLWTSEQ